jgi:hypothetical protein
MLEPEPFDRYQREKSPLLFHVTTSDAVESILREGLRPGSELTARMWEGFFATRPGHVYLTGLNDVAVIQVRGEPRILAVDLSQLDPALVDPDEDIVAHHLALMVDADPPERRLKEGVEAPGQSGGRATWADTTPGFDRSEVTERSLFEHQRVSYRGTIPPQALQLVDAPSQPVSALVDGLSQRLGELRPPPPAGMALTEAARVRVLGDQLIRGLLTAAEIVGPCDVRDHDAAEATSEELRWRAAELRRGDLEDIRRSVIVSAAAEVANQVGELDLDAAKLALDSATLMTSAAADGISALVRDQVLSEADARELVNAAITSAETVPWNTGFTETQLSAFERAGTSETGPSS